MCATTSIRVRFSEVDSMQVVWHGVYVRYFEDGREAFGRTYPGIGYMDFYRNGYTAPIVDMQLQYLSPLTVDDNGSSLEDVLPDERTGDPAQNVSDETIRRQLEKLLSGLSERERTILTMRFGLLGERVRTLQEISDHFNISRERVRQLEMQTLNKLRTAENKRIFGAQQ